MTRSFFSAAEALFVSTNLLPTNRGSLWRHPILRDTASPCSLHSVLRLQNAGQRNASMLPQAADAVGEKHKQKNSKISSPTSPPKEAKKALPKRVNGQRPAQTLLAMYNCALVTNLSTRHKVGRNEKAHHTRRAIGHGPQLWDMGKRPTLEMKLVCASRHRLGEMMGPKISVRLGKGKDFQHASGDWSWTATVGHGQAPAV